MDSVMSFLANFGVSNVALKPNREWQDVPPSPRPRRDHIFVSISGDMFAGSKSE